MNIRITAVIPEAGGHAMRMEQIIIRSKNADYQKLEVLKANRNKRHRYGEFLVEGVRNINQAQQNGWEFSAFLSAQNRTLSGWAGEKLGTVKAARHYLLMEPLMNELSGKEDSSELMAIVKMREDRPEKLSFSENPMLALFDRPSNKGNLGTMLRSCDALGVEGLLLTGHGVDPYDPDVISSSMGSFFKVPFARLESSRSVEGFIRTLKTQYPAFRVFGTTAHSKNRIFEENLSGPLLFMIGNETEGLSHHLSTICDSLLSIPMNRFSTASSFNVSCAGTVLFYEAMRQRFDADLQASDS